MLFLIRGVNPHLQTLNPDLYLSGHYLLTVYLVLTQMAGDFFK